MKQGIKLSNEEYFGHSAFNASSIKTILENPYNYFNGIEKPKTKSLEFGEKVHKLVLESDLEYLTSGERIVVEPNFGNLTLKANKVSKQEFLANNANNYIVSKNEFDCAKSLIDSQFGELFFNADNRKNGFVETCYFGKIFDYSFKCKPDFFIPNLNVCIDLKTTNDSHERDFLQSVIKYKYYIQAYIYSKILEIPKENFIFVVIEKEPPYYIGCYTVSQFFDLAEKDVLFALEIIKNKHLFNANIRIHDFSANSEINYIKDLQIPTFLMV